MSQELGGTKPDTLYRPLMFCPPISSGANADEQAAEDWVSERHDISRHHRGTNAPTRERLGGTALSGQQGLHSEEAPGREVRSLLKRRVQEARERRIANHVIAPIPNQ